MLKIAFHTLGCKVNQYETEAMEQLFEENGYKIVEFNQNPEIYILNTCTVTNMADRKSRQMISKARKQNEEAIIVVVGCYAQAARDVLEQDRTIDIVIGTNQKNNIVKIVQNFLNEKQKIQCVDDLTNIIEYEPLSIKKVSNKTRAYIKIQDGCNQFCSYCIIPYMRGRVRSRNAQDVINEVSQLVTNGYKEIVITGIHIASYGVDLKDTNLLMLIKKLNQIDGLNRIRLGSLEPNLINRDFVRELSILERVCPHFHLSLQSGCDNTLKRMNRKYTTQEFDEKVEILREFYDNPAITTDIIVGFPGETEEEFEQTYNFVKKIRFADTHIFKYSKRQGTKAAEFDNQVTESIKQIRSQQLIKKCNENKEDYQNSFINKEIDILFEEVIMMEGQSYAIGHSKEYLQVGVKSKEGLVNNIKKVKILNIDHQYLVGNIID